MNIKLYAVFIFFLLHSCKEDFDYELVLKNIKNNNANIQAVINGEEFYDTNYSTFTGEVLLNENAIRINVVDEHKSNVILSLTSNKKIVKGTEINIDLDNQSNNNLMIGKLTDGKNNKGLGYLMTEGKITIEKIEKEKLIVLFKGKAAQFLEFNDKNKWQDIHGHIIMKAPNYKIPGNYEF